MLDIVNVEYFTEEGVEYKKEIYNNGTTVVTPVPQPSAGKRPVRPMHNDNVSWDSMAAAINEGVNEV